MKNVALIDYGAGNLRSVYNALNKLGVEPIITSNPDEILQADKVIFPGVGAARPAMKRLQEQGLDVLIPKLTQPVLGICLGMQMFCNYSEEDDTTALGVIEENVLRFEGAPRKLHMGWNSVEEQSGPLFKEIAEGSYFYFVHGYYVPKGNHTVGTTTFGTTISASFQYNNFYGVQFHPEKSGPVGAQLLSNFLTIRP